MRKALIVLGVLFLCITLHTNGQTPFMIVESGKSDYNIVCPKLASVNERRAASLLQDYIKKMTLVDLAIITDDQPATMHELLIGNTNRTSFPGSDTAKKTLNPDGYWIRTYGSKLYILGGDGRGVIYGVTGFLEDHLGCRILSPEVEYVPHYNTILLNEINDWQQPVSAIRIVNGSLCYDSNYKDFRKLTTIADLWNDGEWQGYFVHTFNRLVPAGKYFDTHPEYFSLVNGKRIPYGQLCLSNPEVLQIAIATLREEMQAHPSIKYWSVSQNDNMYNCQCDRCKAIDKEEGSPSGALLRFVNAVAQAFPDKTITTLAYQYTRTPPLISKPEKNVMVTLCTIELNRSKPIADDPSSLSFMNDIKGWSAICNNIMLWDYEVQFTNYLCPFPLFHTLQPNIQMFNKYNVKAHFQQSNAEHGVEFAELKTYYLSKILWNPNANGNSIIADFIHYYYGEAAPYIQSYFNDLHAACQKTAQGLDIYGSPVHYSQTFLSPEYIKHYDSLFNLAEAAVKGSDSMLQRVRVARLPLQFATMEIAKADLFGEQGWYHMQQSDYVVKPEMKQMLDDFYASCKKNNIVYLNENGLTAETYYQNTLRFIDVQLYGNLAFQKTVSCNPMPDARYFCKGTSTLTNGVKGTDDYKINWLGWEGQDVVIVVDLGKVQRISSISIGTLQYPKSWILHPASIACQISADSVKFTTAVIHTNDPADKAERDILEMRWLYMGAEARYVKFEITASKILPAWHNYAGNKSWVFVDEIVIK